MTHHWQDVLLDYGKYVVGGAAVGAARLLRMERAKGRADQKAVENDRLHQQHTKHLRRHDEEFASLDKRFVPREEVESIASGINTRLDDTNGLLREMISLMANK